MKHNQVRRLQELEATTAPAKRIRYMLRWSSQDHDEALRQWEASLQSRGDPLLPSDQVYCVVFNDIDGSKRGDWKLAEAPSYRGEKREQTQ